MYSYRYFINIDWQAHFPTDRRVLISMIYRVSDMLNLYFRPFQASSSYTHFLKSEWNDISHIFRPNVRQNLRLFVRNNRFFWKHAKSNFPWYSPKCFTKSKDIRGILFLYKTNTLETDRQIICWNIGKWFGEVREYLSQCISQRVGRPWPYHCGRICPTIQECVPEQGYQEWPMLTWEICQS